MRVCRKPGILLSIASASTVINGATDRLGQTIIGVSSLQPALASKGSICKHSGIYQCKNPLEDTPKGFTERWTAVRLWNAL